MASIEFIYGLILFSLHRIQLFKFEILVVFQYTLNYLGLQIVFLNYQVYEGYNYPIMKY